MIVYVVTVDNDVRALVETAELAERVKVLLNAEAGHHCHSVQARAVLDQKYVDNWENNRGKLPPKIQDTVDFLLSVDDAVFTEAIRQLSPKQVEFLKSKLTRAVLKSKVT